eukprot:Filipodium_phascolosomae@DN14_c0_g2_i1.p1
MIRRSVASENRSIPVENSHVSIPNKNIWQGRPQEPRKVFGDVSNAPNTTSCEKKNVERIIRKTPCTPTPSSSAIDNELDFSDLFAEDQIYMNKPEYPVVYMFHIFKNLRSQEKECLPNLPKIRSLHTSDEIRKRHLAVEWTIQLHDYCRQHMETLFISINLLDRVMSLRRVKPEELQILSAACLLIASKYEEMEPIPASEIRFIAGDSFSLKDI